MEITLNFHKQVSIESYLTLFSTHMPHHLHPYHFCTSKPFLVRKYFLDMKVTIKVWWSHDHMRSYRMFHSNNISLPFWFVWITMNRMPSSEYPRLANRSLKIQLRNIIAKLDYQSQTMFSNLTLSSKSCYKVKRISFGGR